MQKVCSVIALINVHFFVLKVLFEPVVSTIVTLIVLSLARQLIKSEFTHTARKNKITSTVDLHVVFKESSSVDLFFTRRNKTLNIDFIVKDLQNNLI